jgi:pimeloyl-ACP methyl ester carboxylesterase
MKVVDIGSGTPIVLIPGIQGRWEWMRPGVDALARHNRVVTFSLADEPTSDGRFDEATGLACYVEQIADAMDSRGIPMAVVCGVSYGGLIAATFAARHSERVSGLVLASATPLSWIPDARVRFYLRAPRLLSPLFCLAALRLHREIAAATPGVFRGVGASLKHGQNVLRHMFSPARMARRVRLLDGLALERELAAVHVPTLIVTGEPALDRVVPVHQTREYLAMWPHAEEATLARTGHLGLITRPVEFARIVTAFAERVSDEKVRLKPDTTYATPKPDATPEVRLKPDTTYATLNPHPTYVVSGFGRTIGDTRKRVV